MKRNARPLNEQVTMWTTPQAHDTSPGKPERWRRFGTKHGGGQLERRNSNDNFWSDAEWIVGADGKARRVEPGVRLLAHGIPARVAKLRALGNAIVPQVAAEFIRAYIETETFA